LIPISKVSRTNQLRRLYGFENTQKQAKELGIQLTIKHYFILVIVSGLVGFLVMRLTSNLLLAGIAVGVGFTIPKMILSSLKYKRRRELLINLPANLRLLASKFRDSKSLQKSLEDSLPIMSGVSTEYFQDLYNSLILGVDSKVALRQIREKVSFKKFDDLCEKILMGQRDGYHARVVDGIRETIDDIAFDIQLLKQLDIENRSKRLNVYIIFGMCWAFPFLFNYMESQLAEELGVQTTFETPLGKILIATMALVTLIGFIKRDKFLRLNLDEL
jgi:Flp pilus assembly protein TadB